MKHILIICSNNAAISQMAEAFLKRITFNRLDVHSAGITPKSIHPLTIRVLNEIGIDMSQCRAKSVNEFYHDKFDYIITLDDTAREKCPAFQGSHTKIHKSMEHPESVKGNEVKKIEAFQRVRDQIKEWLTDFVERYQLI
jgi:arsenate reductase